MKRIVTAMLLVVSLFVLTSCATVVSESKYPVTITSEPQGAKITITDDANRTVYVGSTPASIMLEAGSGFFSKASYTIKFEKEGFAPSIHTITSTLDGWYWGNLLFGDVLGMIIIDPMTGAMWKLDPIVFMELESTQSGLTVSVMDVNNVPESWKSALVRIS